MPETRDPGAFGSGFRTSLLICVALLVAGAVLAAALIRDDVRADEPVAAVPVPQPVHLRHCAVGGPPLLCTSETRR